MVFFLNLLGFLCASYVNVKRLVVFVFVFFSEKGQKREGRRRRTGHTPVTQPIASRKGGTGELLGRSRF